jgi:hypothetical protein
VRFRLWLLCNWQATRTFTDWTSCLHDNAHGMLVVYVGLSAISSTSITFWRRMDIRYAAPNFKNRQLCAPAFNNLTTNFSIMTE